MRRFEFVFRVGGNRPICRGNNILEAMQNLRDTTSYDITDIVCVNELPN